ARSIHPKEAQKMIRKGAKSALKNLSKFRQLTMDPPFTLNLRMLNSGMADNAEIMPGAVRKDSLTIEYRSNDLMTLFKGFLALLQLGAASIPKIKKK
ncbi:MAG: M55 family metallopeptidase, partial [Thermoplasmata archaeon]|nr:M55 family metallopeptidase [Thermoplasmata archaeon]